MTKAHPSKAAPTGETAEERLKALDAWLLKTYQANFELWETTQGPELRRMLHTRLQMLYLVALMALTGQDDVVVIDRRLEPFTRHTRRGGSQ